LFVNICVNMPEESQYKFFPLHKHRNLISECVKLLNSTWPVSPTYRSQTLERSNDNFPTSLVYMDTSTDPHTMVGHVRLRRIFEKKDALMLTSVIVDKQLRDRKIGMKMMTSLEGWARSRGFTSFFLTSSNAVGFYRKCGFTDAELQPVQPINFSSKISNAMMKFHSKSNNIQNELGDYEVWLSKDF